ncbi:conserved exported hypothetical protein [Verrucomicrobia bacterium]|nr:conserved exported hypothetical protein [Verrucomicrobiota bacterium]
MKALFNRFWMAALAVCLYLPAARAYPPAPEVLIYGIVKDQYGNPIANPSDTVILQTPSGTQVVTGIQPNLAIGINYALWVPMDSGINPTLYATNALTNGQPYTLYVYDSGLTNLPMEMAAAPFPIAPPSQSVLKNLTLGSDANHDGIPDAWELAFLQSLGLNIPLADINPNEIYTHDGRTLYQEYLLGNYPYNPNAFAITILNQKAGSALISFTAIAGRTYTVYGSPDLKSWSPLSFTVPALGAQVLSSFFSQQIQPLQIRTIQPANAPPMQFFRLALQ